MMTTDFLPLSDHTRHVNQIKEDTRSTLIYGLGNPNFPGKLRYAGKTVNSLKQRISGHIAAARRGCNLPVHRWIRDLLANDVTPQIIFLDIVQYGMDWEDVEKKWIEKLRAEDSENLNVTHGGGGGGMRGRVSSDATRKKISIKSKGRQIPRHVIEAARIARLGSRHTPRTCIEISKKLLSPEINAKLIAAQAKRIHDARALIEFAHERRGIPLTEEHRKNIGDGNRGKRHNSETIDKMKISAKNRKTESLGFLGKTHKDETKNKISDALKGRKLSPETLAKRKATMDLLGTREAISKKLKGRKVTPEVVAKGIATRKQAKLDHQKSIDTILSPDPA